MKINSIKHKFLFSIVIIIIIFGSISTATVFFYSRAVFIKNITQNMKIMFVAQKEELKQVFSFYEQIVKNLSQQDLIISFLTDSQKNKGQQINDQLELNQEVLSYLKQYNINQTYSAIYLMDVSGQVLVSTQNSFVGKNYSFRTYFKKAMHNDFGVDVARGVTSKEVGYYFAHVVKDHQNNKLGVLVMKMKPEIVHKSIRLADVKAGLNNFLVDSNGVIIYSNRVEDIYRSLGTMTNPQRQDNTDKKRFPGLNIKGLGYNNLQKDLENINKSKIYNIYNLEKKNNEIVLIDTFQNLPFFLLVVDNFDTYNQRALKIALSLTILIVISVFLVVILMLILINTYFRPFNTLILGVQRIAKGDLDYQIIVKNKNDEFGILAQSFNGVIKQLKEEKHNTERKIEQRTKRLKKMNKLMVGRELKMIELKEEIKDLKTNLKNKDYHNDV